MAAIYEPSGAAREYSPLALNYVRGCDHGCVYCLDGDTLILLSDKNTIPIKDIQIGDKIIGLHKSGLFVNTIVKNKISTIKKAYKIILSDGSNLICSADHRWLTTKGWKYTFRKEKGQRPTLSLNSYIKGIEGNIKVESIICLNEEIIMYDISTGTENFMANGLISHNCYVPKMMKRFDSGYIHSNVYMKEESKLKKEILLSCKKNANSEKQVFLSFTTDPYSHFNNDTKFTRWVLECLLEHNIPVSILSKGGYNVLQDLDVILRFGKNIQVGGSLTFTSNEDTLKWEKNSSMPYQRFDALKQLHEAGVRTWASMEPVIYTEQSLEIMEITHSYVDAYKIGKLNHFPKHEVKFDWTKFLNDAVAIMRKHNKEFYIKKDLLEHKDKDLYLHPNETNMDYLALKNSNILQLS